VATSEGRAEGHWLLDRAEEIPPRPHWRRDHRAGEDPPCQASAPSAPLLLVEDEPRSLGRLQYVLGASGFAVTRAPTITAAEAAAETSFRYAVVEIRFCSGSLGLIRRLHALQPGMRIVVVTDVDSFASAVLALRAGAADYLAQPVGEAELVDALLDRRPPLPPVPETPLGLKRTCWEHAIRMFEQCDRNVTETARRLGMHRRSMQRILRKRAPYRHPP
jgi:two-component system response regulator RegA